MPEGMNPPPLGIPRIEKLKDLKRKLGVHLKFETDDSGLWNDYTFSYAILIYELYYEHYSSVPDFRERAQDAAVHNAVLSILDVIGKQLYNFRSLQPAYERKVLECLREHIQREEAKRAASLIRPVDVFNGVPKLIAPKTTIAEQLKALKQESGLTYQQLAEGIGTDITTVQRHCAGKLQPRADKLDLYEKTLGERLRRAVTLKTP